jgi:transcriptional regulator with XRE-family HTH domain
MSMPDAFWKTRIGCGLFLARGSLAPKTPSLIERGEANPTWGTVQGIAAALGVSMGELAKLADKITASEK